MGGRWEGGSGWGTRVYPWQMYVNVWQNQCNIVKCKKKKNMPRIAVFQDGIVKGYTCTINAFTTLKILYV